jgi:hypothetical protein
MIANISSKSSVLFFLLILNSPLSAQWMKTSFDYFYDVPISAITISSDNTIYAGSLSYD